MADADAPGHGEGGYGTGMHWPSYGTGMHWPSCIDGQCTGCLPPYEPPGDEHRLDPTVFRADADPVVKYDGDGQPVYASQLAGNRAMRRAAAREARGRDRG